MGFRKKGTEPKKFKHHKNDKCFRCRERFQFHGNAKDKQGNTCTEFEYIPPSSRDKKHDLLFTAAFASESNPANMYVVTAWRQGDYSCNCGGWITQRKCWHCDTVAADPEHYKAKATATVNGGAGSVEATVADLNRKMAEMEAAVKSGNPVQIAKLQAEIDYQRQMFSVADKGLAARFDQVVASIEQHVWGNAPEPKLTQPAPEPKHESGPVIVGADEDPFSV